LNDDGKVLLVGSIARPDDGWTIEDVFRRTAAALGPFVSMLPDGEVGDRSRWIQFIARHAYYGNPDLISTTRHTYEDWQAKSYDDLWKFKVKDGVTKIHLKKIGYAEEAKRSYEIFRALREQGVIPAGTRFLVAYPLTESGVRAFVGTAKDYEIMWEAYNDAVRRELEDLAASIPHRDLAIQWDLARETMMIEGAKFSFPDDQLSRIPADPMERYCRALSELCPAIPADVWLGLHVCYGSLKHQPGGSPDGAHAVGIKDLSVGVSMSNEGSAAAGRRVDYVHMPVQLSDFSDNHYAPLGRLEIGSARVYLGVIDPTDGLSAALQRIEIARRHLPDFGIATACGWGRRPLSEKISDIIALNREVAEAAFGT
jgi:hypothetical protein